MSSADLFAQDDGSAALFRQRVASPTLELGAYEELWTQAGQTFAKLAKLFRESKDGLLSQFVDPEVADQRAQEVLEVLKKKRIADAGFVIQGTVDYPEGLNEARHAIRFLYYRGDLELLREDRRRVAVVGSRKASDKGLRRARKLARRLAADGAVVVSGLAKGIDAAAHEGAIEATESEGRTIGVIGTPISEAYPRENAELQERIAQDHLLLSQVPVIRYRSQTPKGNRFFFPERNAAMSALTDATVIVEAGETSGSLLQARAALGQGRKLFILDSCFGRGLAWPEKLQEKGAIRVAEYEEIKGHLDG